MKQPKISKELLREVYGNRKIEWEDHITHIGPCFSIRRPGNLGRGIKDFKNINDIVHDMKVFFSENIDKYNTILNEHALVTKVAHRESERTKRQDFWCNEGKILFDPQRVFDACQLIIENYNKVEK